MALPQGNNPTVDGIWFRPRVINPDAVSGATVPYNCKSVDVQTVVNDANDWIGLPTLADVPNGHVITICCNAGTNFEMRTPSASNEKINNVDADGTQEYLCTDTDVIRVVKMSSTAGWMGYSYTRLGAVRAAVIPD